MLDFDHQSLSLDRHWTCNYKQTTPGKGLHGLLFPPNIAFYFENTANERVLLNCQSLSFDRFLSLQNSILKVIGAPKARAKKFRKFLLWTYQTLNLYTIVSSPLLTHRSLSVYRYWIIDLERKQFRFSVSRFSYFLLFFCVYWYEHEKTRTLHRSPVNAAIENTSTTSALFSGKNAGEKQGSYHSATHVSLKLKIQRLSIH